MPELSVGLCLSVPLRRCAMGLKGRLCRVWGVGQTRLHGSFGPVMGTLLIPDFVYLRSNVKNVKQLLGQNEILMAH